MVTYFGNFLFIYPLKIASLRFLSLHTRRRRLSETGYHVCFFVKYIPYISIHSILKPPPRIENENSIGFCFTVGFDTCNYSGITNNNLLWTQHRNKHDGLQICMCSADRTKWSRNLSVQEKSTRNMSILSSIRTTRFSNGGSLLRGWQNGSKNRVRS